MRWVLSKGKAGITLDTPLYKSQPAKRTRSSNFHPMDGKHTKHDADAAQNTYRGDRKNGTLNTGNFQYTRGCEDTAILQTNFGIERKGIERVLKHHMSINSTELPSSSDPSIEADNRKATPRHVGWDPSVQGTSGTYFSTHFWTNYIDHVSPHAHDSRIGRM